MGFNSVEAAVRIPLLFALVQFGHISSVIAQAVTILVAFVVRYVFHARVVYRPRRTTPVSPLIAKAAPAGVSSAEELARAAQGEPVADVSPDAPVRESCCSVPDGNQTRVRPASPEAGRFRVRTEAISRSSRNGLLRDYFPKGTRLGRHSPQHLLDVENELDDRRRMILDDRTPVDRSRRC